MKHVYIDGELELFDAAEYFPKLLRKDYTVSLKLKSSEPDPSPI